MYYVGLTGGIGSGKSIVCKVFDLLNIRHYNADEGAKNIMNTDPGIQEKLKHEFGSDIYEDNILNKEKLAGIIFQDKSALKTINSIVHPRVMEDFFSWATQKKNARYVIFESAIVFESGLERHFNKVIAVSAPERLRIKRVMQRDGVGEEKILQRMDNQLSDEEKNALADMCIVNDDEQLVVPQVLKVNKKVLTCLMHK